MDSVSSALSTAAGSQLHHPHSPFDPYRDPFDLSSSTGGHQQPRKNSAVEEPPESWSSGGNNSVHSPLEASVNQNHSVDGTGGAIDIKMQSTDGSAAHDSKKKRFVCPHCTRTFARSGHLQRHERSHTNERPFQCPQCSSTFGRLDTLLRHERTLHGSSTSAASNNPNHHRTQSTHLTTKPILNPSNSTLSQHPVQPLDPPLTTRVRESPTMAQHNLHHSPPTIPGLSPLHHNPQSPGMLLNGTSFSPPSNLLPSHTSPSMVPPALAHPTPHKASFSPLAESPALWDSFTSLEALQASTPSASFGDIQSQFSRLLFNLLPSGPSLPTTPAPVTQTPAAIAATPNLDSFIHSPSPMSFPVSAERGMVVPTHSTSMAANAISSPSNSSSSYPPGNKTSFLRSLEDFDRGVLEAYIAEADIDVSLRDFELPRKDALNRYLCAYFEGMHQHHPFIHTPTFDPVSIKAPLFLSMCCIGALYCFERDTSRKLHVAARKLVYSHLENKSDEEAREVWVLQTLLLTMIYAAYSGDIKIFERGISLQSVLANLLRSEAEVVRSVEDSLKSSPMSWEQWIQIEGFKRHATYFSILCFFTQLSMTFDIPPNLTNAEPPLSLPCSEAEWRAPDPESWYMQHTSANAPPTPTFRDALQGLFSGHAGDQNMGIRFSHFGSFVMINAICSQLWARLKLRNAEPDLDLGSIEYALDQWQRAWNADPDSSMSPTSPHGPLSFNASALYRMANIRIFRDYSRVKASFRTHDIARINQVMAEDVSGTGWERSQDMMRAIMPATLQLQIPIKMGIKLVARTAALIWSVEHVLCATETGLLLCDWLRTIENDPPGTVLGPEEQKALNLVKELLSEADIFIRDGERLSAATLKVWAGTFDDVWVWGITPMLAKSLRRFAQEIQESDSASQVGRRDTFSDNFGRVSSSTPFSGV